MGFGARMLFPTIQFAIFFLLVFGLSWSLHSRPYSRKFVLLLASYGFYGAWDWRFMLLLFEASAINYLIGLWLQSAPEHRRKLILYLGVAFNLSVLGFFKYFGFFLESMNGLLGNLGFSRDMPIMEILLPVGISFFTFQGISYVVDVYRREIKASKSFIDLLLYISFFPQLVAGPIVRAKDFMPQLERRANPGAIRAHLAFILIALGLFKKIVIAHYLSIELVNPAFESPESYGTLDLVLGAYGYAVQIYCDFSAYSDMAIGFAYLLGFEFPKNFNQPYRADSLRDFWHRWHISLSSWLRDYLYIPLGGSRLGQFKTYRNLFLTMLLGGFWHGAAWNFVFWGVLHGSGLGVEKFFREELSVGGSSVFSKVIKTVITFHFVCLTWIFFASETFTIALEYLSSLTNYSTETQLVSTFSLTLLAVGMLGQFMPSDSIEVLEDRLASIPLVAHGAALGFVLVLISAMSPGALAPFIYFRF
jgi:alginate O-acetyltransferase complex protein AlgI